MQSCMRILSGARAATAAAAAAGTQRYATVLSQLHLGPKESNAGVAHGVQRRTALTVPPSSEKITVMDPEEGTRDALPARFVKLNLTIESHDHTVLDSYVEFIERSGKFCELDLSGRVALPTKFERWTVLKGPHVHKQHRDQFERRMHRRLLQIRDVSGVTGEVFMDYVLRMLPPGVQAKVTHQTAEPPSGELAKELPHLFGADGAAAEAMPAASSSPVPADVVAALAGALSAEEVAVFGGALQRYRDSGDATTLGADLMLVAGESRASLLEQIRPFVKDESGFSKGLAEAATAEAE